MTKEETKIIKGVAILLMLIHHLWGFPDRIAATIFNDNASGIVFYCIGLFGYYCVSLFSFSSGYAWGASGNSDNTVKKIFSRISALYINYWRVFLVFIPIAFIFFGSQIAYCKQADICDKYSNFRLGEFLMNLSGISCTYNNEWWYILWYVIMIICAPLLYKIVMKIPWWLSSALCILLPQFFSSFFIGMIFAYHNLFAKLSQKLKPSLFFDIAVLVILIPTKSLLWYNQIINGISDILLVPLLIYVCIDLIKRSKTASRLFAELGERSTTMWLTHTFYIYYFGAAARIIVFSKSAILSLIMFVIITYCIARLLDTIWNKIIKRKEVTQKETN